ncbi:FCD domain-containing protein [Williamsia sp. 1135]|uniref:FadR/GntR family transcriptional regulator n=1 Tax=Williamsia sp. 1135 TaxID=1889262 RepID=UPI000A0FAFD5|nr:FCD domain-containing protein [Williamsia sp. 1135]ORM36863.1 GntR family transcriptional regulator [Williamsia sp. 1135]
MTLAVGPVATARRHLESVIGDGGFAPGDKLPTERELAASAGVSRAVIRTALDELADSGVVVRYVGRGTFLAPQAIPESSTSASFPSPAEIMTSRLVLEPEILPVTVSAATQQDIDEMHRCLRGGDAARASEDFERWDTLLHHSFALATHNAVLISLSQLLIDSRNQPVWGGLKRRTFSAERRQCYCDEHKAIVSAIEDRDPDAAREAMRVHLRHVRTTLLGDHA